MAVPLKLETIISPLKGVIRRRFRRILCIADSSFPVSFIGTAQAARLLDSIANFPPESKHFFNFQQFLFFALQSSHPTKQQAKNTTSAQSVGTLLIVTTLPYSVLHASAACSGSPR